MLCMWRGGFGLLVMHCWLLPRIGGQNIVRHPRLPVELGGTAELQEVSKNYFVIKHRDARTPEDTPRTEQHKQRDEIMAREKAAQQAQLWQHYKLKEMGVANATMVRKEYVFAPPKDFHVGILINPCLGKEHDCCMQKYGMPEYRVEKGTLDDPNRLVGGGGISSVHSLLKDEYNHTMTQTHSRLADDHVRLNEGCVNDSYPFKGCVGDLRQRAKPDLRSRQELVVDELLPDCWDHNNTVRAGQNCTDADGNVHPTCLAVGFSQSAFIFVCGGEFADSPECGTFLEVHQTSTSTWQAEHVHVYEYHAVVPIQCPGYTCAEVFTPGTRFEVRNAKTADGRVLFGPVTVRRVVEMNRYGRPCDRRKQAQGLDECIQTWIYWNEDITGPGYHACSLLYTDDEERYADMKHPAPEAVDTYRAMKDHHRPRRCSIDKGEETIEPLFIRGSHRDDIGAVSIFTVGNNDEVLAETKLQRAQVDGYQTTTISTLYRDAAQREREAKLKTLWQSEYSRSNPVDKYAQGQSLPTEKYQDALLDERKILCARDYELWWVQRTPARNIVLKRKGFRVESPPCDYDIVNERYRPYASQDKVGNTVEKEHIVKDVFGNNHRQWYLPGDERRTINADGLPQYGEKGTRWARGSPWWNVGRSSPQHAAHKNDYFFDH